MDKSSLVAVGKVVRTHGVRGALKVLAYGETLVEMEAGDKLLTIEGGGQRQLTLASLNSQKRLLIVQFEEIDGMDQAQAITGKDLFVDKDRLPGLPSGEYYHFQLIGLSVETKEGKPLGTLSAVFETGGHDVYVVEQGGKELLIPAIEQVIVEVDLLNGRLVVDLPEGLQ
ncbi:MAG: ribosome maturation factor RimM [Syntrophobacteraceae bacterium]|jgi:16S rRNA processing protein RimM